MLSTPMLRVCGFISLLELRDRTTYIKDQFFCPASLEKLTLTENTFCDFGKNAVIKFRSI
jgi:hypothetical protein